MDAGIRRETKTFTYTEPIIISPKTPGIRGEKPWIFNRPIPLPMGLGIKLLSLRLKATAGVLHQASQQHRGNLMLSINLLPSDLDPNQIHFAYKTEPNPQEIQLTMPGATDLLDFIGHYQTDSRLGLEVSRNYENDQIHIMPGDLLYLSLGISGFPFMAKAPLSHNRIIFSYVLEYTVEYL
ncbi:MAG: hypothetical protein QXI19_11015 [Candidatus Caldarchaeum sp.]